MKLENGLNITDRDTTLIVNDIKVIKISSERNKVEMINEIECYKLLNGANYLPKIFAYDKEKLTIEIERMMGMNLPEFVYKKKRMPYGFAKNLYLIFNDMLDKSVSIGPDRTKYYEHYFIDEETEEIKVIDYGVCDIITCKEAIDNERRELNRRYAFLIETSMEDDKKISAGEFRQDMYCSAVSKEIVDDFFANMGTLKFKY